MNQNGEEITSLQGDAMWSQPRWAQVRCERPGWIHPHDSTAIKLRIPVKGGTQDRQAAPLFVKSTPFLQVFFRGRLKRWLKRKIFLLRELWHFQSTWEEFFSHSAAAIVLWLLEKWGVLSAELDDSVLFDDNMVGFVLLTPNPPTDLRE